MCVMKFKFKIREGKENSEGYKQLIKKNIDIC